MKAALWPTSTWSDKRLKPLSLAIGDRHIGQRLPPPLLRRSRVQIEQMGDGQAGAHGGTAAAIKMKKRRRRFVAQTSHDMLDNAIHHTCRSEALTFNAEITKLVYRIENAELAIEFETIDDLDGVSKPDMLGSQVAVTLDDFFGTQPREKQLLAFAQETPLCLGNTQDRANRQRKARMQQDLAII